MESLACVNAKCQMYGKPGQENLIIRKEYGLDKIRYLRCRVCQQEFSERKNTALWNSKVPEEKAVAVAEHLAEGHSVNSIARLTKVDVSTVKRLQTKVGHHSQVFHHTRVKALEIDSLQGDERYGFAGDKQTAVWEAELIDPASKFVISHQQGQRDQDLIRRLLEDGASRLRKRHDLTLFTDGLSSYETLFPEIFGQPYQPPRQTHLGRPAKIRYRIPRSLAHVRIVKHHQGRRLAGITIHFAHGSKKRVAQSLDFLGYNVPNTSAIERRNGTARLMASSQVRRSLAFAKRPETNLNLGWWAVTVYNWARPHRSLKRPLPQPIGNKRYQQRTPAMALGFAYHIFSIPDLLLSQLFPSFHWR